MAVVLDVVRESGSWWRFLKLFLTILDNCSSYFGYEGHPDFLLQLSLPGGIVQPIPTLNRTPSHSMDCSGHLTHLSLFAGLGDISFWISVDCAFGYDCGCCDICNFTSDPISVSGFDV